MKLKLAKVENVVEREYLGVKFKIARYSKNVKFLTKFQQSTPDSLRKISINELAEHGPEMMEVLAKSYAGTILVGWETFDLGEGPIEYNEDNAASLLYNDDEVFAFVNSIAKDDSNFVKSALNPEALAKK